MGTVKSLSGRDGRTICKKLKVEKITRNIPIIMISAHPSVKENALQCGAEDFLSKPFDIEDLLRRVEKYTKTIN